MIELRDVTVRAGPATLLDGITLGVRGGELLALFGPNGAGKSTLLGAIAGDRPPTRGTVRLGGRDLRSLSPRELALRRAVLRQKSSLGAAFTALEVVRLGQPRADDAAARRCLAEVELADLADRLYPSLSGGEQQRVQLARVLAQLHGCAEAALLLDEPSAALDLRQTRLVETVARRCAERGHAVVFVAHDAGLVARAADRVVVLRRGAVVCEGPPRSVLTPSIVSCAFDLAVELEHTPSGALVVRPVPTPTEERARPPS